MENMPPVRVRVAPSPTGHMHLGNIRTALYDYLLAKKTGGTFILRIEDTDLKRTVEGAEQEIFDGLRWLGLRYDEGPDVGGAFGPYRQTERRDIYRQHAQILIDGGHAYPCFCSMERLAEMRARQQKQRLPPRYDGTCRKIDAREASLRVADGAPHVVRFKVPTEGTTVAHDIVRGHIAVENRNIDDYVLLKSDGLPTYHLGAMVDDHLMQITHVLRGAEWLSTFPLHVNVVRAFGWAEPAWVHLSLFLKPSGKGKMSKRDAADAIKDGHSIFVKDVQELGFIPEGVLNWIALMGWGVPEDDVMSLDQMIERFDLRNLTPSPAAINFAKLDYFNGAHIRSLALDDLAGRLAPHFARHGFPMEQQLLRQVTPLIQERIVTLQDAPAMAGFFARDDVEPIPEQLIGKGLTVASSAAISRDALGILQGAPTWKAANLEGAMRAYVAQAGLEAGQVFGILRLAVTGQRVSPPLFESIEIIGREKTLRRVSRAVATLESLAKEEKT